MDSTFLARGSDADDLQVAKSAGSFSFDARGRKYIDFLAGWCVGNVGWDNRRSIRLSNCYP
jgi:4-aminobutyrate aminotransferase-like enzyme